jgi:hypothetical protein
MPTVLRVREHRFFFFSNEGHEPQHIHVETAGSYAKFWLDLIALDWSVGYNARDLGQLWELVEGYQELLKEKWD